MITVPQAFATATVIREGDAGHKWIQTLPDLVEDLCQHWNLKGDGPVIHGYLGLVIPVRRVEAPCVLKVSWPDEATSLLTDELFSQWCQHNHIPQETDASIQRIRSSPPVRNRASNVSRRSPSVKMGRTIQFESHHVELWGIYEMERDNDVLEYDDQSARIQLQSG